MIYFPGSGFFVFVRQKISGIENAHPLKKHEWAIDILFWCKGQSK